MGYAASILAVKCADRDRVLNALQFTQCEKPITWAKATSKFISRAGVASLGSEWTLLVGYFEGFDEALLNDASELGLLVTCSVYENLGFSEAKAYRAGGGLWSIEHNACDYGENDLRIEGELTPEVRAVYQRFWAKHRAREPMLVTLADGTEEPIPTDWLLEIAPEAAAAICGLRPDYPLIDDAPSISLIRIKRWPVYRRMAARSKLAQRKPIRSPSAQPIEPISLPNRRFAPGGKRALGQTASVISVAINSADKNAVLSALRLEDTGEPTSLDEALNPRRRRGGVAVLPSGWVYITGNLAHLDERRLQAVSRSALLITSSLEGCVGVSEVRAYLRGRRIWYARHDADKHKYHLRARGELPEQFTEIRDRLRKAAIDPEAHEGIIDIPLELAKSVCGFRPDFYLQPHSPEIGFTALRRVRPPKPTTPFWHRFKVGLRNGWKAAKASRKARLRRHKRNANR